MTFREAHVRINYTLIYNTTRELGEVTDNDGHDIVPFEHEKKETDRGTFIQSCGASKKKYETCE